MAQKNTCYACQQTIAISALISRSPWLIFSRYNMKSFSAILKCTHINICIYIHAYNMYVCTMYTHNDLYMYELIIIDIWTNDIKREPQKQKKTVAPVNSFELFHNSNPLFIETKPSTKRNTLQDICEKKLSMVWTFYIPTCFFSNSS